MRSFSVHLTKYHIQTKVRTFMPRKALYNGLGRHSLLWQANPAQRWGWLVGVECLPRGPIVKGTVE